MGRRRISIFAIFLACGLGVTSITPRVTLLSAASAPPSRSVYHASAAITQTYVIDYPLSRKPPPNSSHRPHITALFNLLRSAHRQAQATYLRVLDTHDGVSFEIAIAPHMGATWQGKSMYDIAMATISGRSLGSSAAWVSRGARSFGLYPLTTPVRFGTNALILVQSGRKSANGATALRLTFTTPERRYITVALAYSRITERSVLARLLQARLLFASATPVALPTQVPTATPVDTKVVPTSTPVSLNAPTPARAATIRALQGAWQPTSVSVGVNASVVWENDDTTSAYSVECVASLSSARCPWTVPLPLPAAAGGMLPTVSVTFSRPGIFTFRDPARPTMQGEVVVGAPGTP